MLIKLVCCTCRRSILIDSPDSIDFAFKLYAITKEIGWVPKFDFNFKRTLVFCSEKCYQAQLTKKGYIRKYLIYKELKNEE